MPNESPQQNRHSRVGKRLEQTQVEKLLCKRMLQ